MSCDVHDWNREGAPKHLPKVLDETLRDGLQSASVRDPDIGDKIALVHAMTALGVDAVTLGMPVARAKQQEDALRLAQEVATQKLPIAICCAARAHERDIAAIADVSQKAGIGIEACIFLGGSPIRQRVDERSSSELEHMAERSVRFARAEGLPVLFITEDSTRSSPEVLRGLYAAAIRAGAERICIADTVGHATPRGTARVVRFVKKVLAELGVDLKIDWHGHRDRGLSIANALAAWSAGAERCHGTALGLGERSGNAPIELLLVNLQLLGWTQRDLSTLADYTRLASRALGVPVPFNAPVVGDDAFRTATGVHASVLSRAARIGLAVSDEVYSAVPASMVGRTQRIDIGPMSGKSNVHAYLEQHGMSASEGLVEQILHHAKASDRVLSESEVLLAAHWSRASFREVKP